MHCQSILKCHDTQVVVQIIDPNPVPDTAVTLNFAAQWSGQCKFKPTQLDIGPFDHHIVLKVLVNSIALFSPVVLQTHGLIEHQVLC